MRLLDEWTFHHAFPIRHHRLENGLEAYLVHNPVASVAACMVHYTVGSALETPAERGLAHFFEHMMFRETETLHDGDFDRIMSEIGGVGLNAFTSYDTTAYLVSVPARHLERVFSLEADRMANLRLSSDLIEAERGAVLGEIHMYQDMPSEQFWNALMAEAFQQHPYHHPIIGYADQVQGFSGDDFRRFYDTHYAPNRAVIVVAGGFEEADVLESLERNFGGLEQGGARPQAVPPDGPWPGDRRKEITHDKISTDYMAMAWRSPGLEHPDMPGLALLSAVLSAGQSSPLYRRLVWDGLATHVSVSLMEADMMLASPALFLVDVSLQHGVEAERAEAVVQEVLQGLARDGIGKADLERGRNQMRLGGYNALRSNMGLARQIGGYVVACGDPGYGERLLKTSEGLDAEHLRDVLQRHMVNAPRLTVVQRPAAGGSS